MGRIQKRYIITLMAFIARFLTFLMRVNVGIAVVAMSSNKTITEGNETKIIPAEFHWTSMETGLIFSAFPCGSFFAFLGGFLVHRVGGSTMAGVSILLSGIIELLSPLILRLNIIALFVARAVLGLLDYDVFGAEFCLQSFATIGLTDLFAHWSPHTERTRLLTFVLTGHMLSGAVNYPLNGYLVYMLGWQSAFYVTGAIMGIWGLIWLCFVANDPACDKFISEAERNYLKSNTIDVSTTKDSIPWRSILSSISVYALFNEFLCASWASSFISNLLPLYVKDMHNINIKDLGLMTGLPMMCNVITLPIFGYLADCLRTHVLSNGKFHRIFIFCGQFLTLVFLLITAMWGDFTASLICFCLIRIAWSMSNTAYGVICIDMAGQYAGVLFAMMQTAFKMGHFLNPLVVGYLVQNHSPDEWNLYFVFLSAVCMYGVIVFLILGSGETQRWAIPSKAKDDENQLSETPHETEK